MAVRASARNSLAIQGKRLNLTVSLNKIGTNLKSPQKKKDKKRREMEAKGLEGKKNECRQNNERRKEKGQKMLL